MSTPHSHRSTTRGLVLMAAALGLSLVSFALSPIWANLIAIMSPTASTTASIRTLWMPLSVALVEGAAALLAVLGFSFLWRGRWEVGGEYVSRSGLAMLLVLISAVAYLLFAVTGILLGYVQGVQFLVPWHGLLGVVGGVFLGFGLYFVLANLPIAGSRPLAAVALALGLAGIALVNLAAIGLRRVRTGSLDGAGVGLALASLTLWLVLCLWGEETLRSRTSASPAAVPSQEP